MPATSYVTIRLNPDTEVLCRTLEVIAKHAQACADELDSLAVMPSMEYDAAAIAEQVHAQVQEQVQEG
jgi:hypothetical protein